MRRLITLNFVLMLLITGALLIAPVYAHHISHSDAQQGTQTESGARATLLQVNGVMRTLCVLSAPLALSIIPIFWIRMTRISGFFLLIFALLGGASIGLFYLPSAAILLIAGTGT